ncbi:MAG TPA: hypothetical protein VHE34_02385 [Puia sp.]|uniref:hypothetical protein n=1 Tax=Puia sp. TaxID=2045100 RepID=UPI002CA34791|nr:hypothetical protein [Puia sp.]HVU94035.1 hypothetical protein [Puia sp.]
MREAMFDKNTPGLNLLNPACTIYQEIAKIAAVMRSSEPLRFGRMYYRSAFHQPGDTLNSLYGGVGGVPVRQGPAGVFIQLHLDGQQFVILE